jgi:hypothetical protein
VALGNRWLENWTISDDDIEYLNGILLEKEVPLSIDELALALIERRIKKQEAALRAVVKDVRIYAPAHSYEIGQRLMFTALDNRIGTVVGVRAGDNPAYGDFSVLKVQFEDGGAPREFAAQLRLDHPLNHVDSAVPIAQLPSAAQIFEAKKTQICERLAEKLAQSNDFVSVAGRWFPRSLMLEVNEGHLNLAEAVLDIGGGEPMPTSAILEQIGGLGKADPALQAFCLDDALNRDPRFDEVGPVDTILWYLRRLEPPEVQSTPPMLDYQPVTFDRTLLSPELMALEAEIADEWSDIDHTDDPDSTDEASILLIYPHRRVGTLPLNHRMCRIFPTARRTPRVYVKLVDAEDKEEFTGWVVRQSRYVFGLSRFYQKHQVPVGARITARRSREPGKIVIEVKKRTKRVEWVRLIVPKDGQIKFEEQKRSLNAEYDDQMILGTDDVAAVDALFQATANSRRSIAAILRLLTTELMASALQGAVHAKTLYSAFNVLRRCPPGPIFAALMTTGDFEHIGGHYWKLRESARKD